jgi:hypothetical protein
MLMRNTPTMLGGDPRYREGLRWHRRLRPCRHEWGPRSRRPHSCTASNVRRCPTLPRPVGCSTIGAGGLSFRVRNGCRAFPLRYGRRNSCGVVAGVVISAVLREPHSGRVALRRQPGRWASVVASPRPISTGQLHTLRCFHFRPINPVVWLGALTHEGWETSSWNELPA